MFAEEPEDVLLGFGREGDVAVVVALGVEPLLAEDLALDLVREVQVVEPVLEVLEVLVVVDELVAVFGLDGRERPVLVDVVLETEDAV